MTAYSTRLVFLLLLSSTPPALSSIHESTLTQFFQFKDATLRLNSFANLAKNNIKMIEQLIRVLERQRDEYICGGTRGCCSVEKPCLVSEGECGYHWDCAGDLFCGRLNCASSAGNDDAGRVFDCCHRVNPRSNFTLSVTCNVDNAAYATPSKLCDLDASVLP